MEHYKKNPMVETLGTVLQLKQVRIHEDWLTGERAQGSFHSHVTLLLWACDGTFTMAGAHSAHRDYYTSEKQTRRGADLLICFSDTPPPLPIWDDVPPAFASVKSFSFCIDTV